MTDFYVGGKLWAKPKGNQDPRCLIGFGLGRMDVGFARIGTTATNAKQTGNTQKNIYPRKGIE